MKTALVAAALAAGSLAVAETPREILADKPRPASTDPNHYRVKGAYYRDREAERLRDADVVLLGDSITHYFEWEQNRPYWKKWFESPEAPFKGLNQAIEGDTTDNLLWRLQLSLDKVCPKAFVLLIGTNNTGTRSEKAEPAEDTAKGLRRIMDEIRRVQPQAKTLVYALFPRGKGATDPCTIRNDKVNALLEKMCDGRQFVYRDIRKEFLAADGTIDKKRLFDGLHPGPEGYEVWLKDMVPELQKIFAAFDADQGVQRAYWERYATRAWHTFRPDEIRRAVAELEKLGVDVAKTDIARRMLPTVRSFETFASFPRAEADIRFPSTLADFGVTDAKEVEAASFGWDAKNATKCLQAAIDSGATTVHVRPQKGPWYVDSVRLRSNLRIVFHQGVKVLMDKTSPLKDKDFLFRVEDCENVILEGEGTGAGGSVLGGYADYAERQAHCKTYGKSVIALLGTRNVLVRNLRLSESAEDGIFFGGLGQACTETFVDDVVIDSHFRQAMSICNADGVYCRKVQFLNTRGNAPTAGIDFEPPCEWLPNAHVYLFDCTFENNDGGGLMFATSTYAPLAVYAKRTHFRRHRAPLVELMPRTGLVLRALRRIPSKVIFEDCDFETYRDEPAFNLQGAPVFDFTVRNCVIRSTPAKSAARSKFVAAPIRLALNRDFGPDGFPPDLVGRGTFENVRCEGYPDGTPAVDVVDDLGCFAVTNAFAGTLTINGTAVDLSAFAYRPDRTKRTAVTLPASDVETRTHFVVPAGGKSCVVRMTKGTLELRDGAENVRARAREGEHLGPYDFVIRPSTDKAEVWSFRQPAKSGAAELQFLSPLSGAVAAEPGLLKGLPKDLFTPAKAEPPAPDVSWGDPIDVACDIFKPLVDRTRLSAQEARTLDAEMVRRRAFAAKGEWTKQYRREVALVERLKQTAKSDADFHDIEMESLNLPALAHNAGVEETAAAENENVCELAAFCSAFKGRLASPDDPTALEAKLLGFGLSLAPKTGELEYDDVRKLVLLRNAILSAK